MHAWEYLLLFASVLVGGGLVFTANHRRVQRLLPLILSFSGAYLLGIAALHLMPGVFGQGDSTVGYWLLGGFFIQLFLEPLSQGVEHGHIHAHAGARPAFGLQIMLGLCIHAFFEGLPLPAYVGLADEHIHQHNDLLFGIVLHKLPAAFALAALLRGSGFRTRTVVAAVLFFAAVSPLAAALSGWLTLSTLWQNRLLALVIGSFLHIATTILFEAEARGNHHISTSKLIAVLLGGALAVAGSLV